MSTLFEARLKEKEIFENLKKNRPELFVVPPISEKELFSRIGITFPFPPRPHGYIRFYFQDFIVEEISKEGIISEIEPKCQEISLKFPCNLGCNLIKIGISTLDAIELLANDLQIKPTRITYAGLKDTNALTSQKVVFRDVSSNLFEKIKKLSFPNLLLTNFSIEKEYLSPGRLFGNRFFIFVRTPERINDRIFSQALEKIKKEGFLNFYFLQRFGEPRFLNHILGKLILQGKYEEAIFKFLTESGPLEIPLIKRKREGAKNFWGNWQKMGETFSEFPFTFRNELSFLSYLKKNPTDFLGALIFMKDITQIFIFSYASYLFNQILSLLNEAELPEKIPLFLSLNLKDRMVYRFWLEKDGIENFEKNIQPFIRFFKLKRRFVKTRIFPREVSFKIFSEGVALTFILEKGAYATTFLTNLFEIKEGLPLPKWVREKEYDIKKEFRLGTIERAKNLLAKEFFSKKL
jgi:tRNA pseudouridine13 synthase